jgi:UrcA family protein
MKTRYVSISAGMAAMILSVGAGLASVPASAGETAADARGGVRHEARVRLDDLDLATDAGRRVLQSRLTSAARRVCGEPDIRNARMASVWRQCYAEALEAALAQVDDERLADWVAVSESSERREAE